MHWHAYLWTGSGEERGYEAERRTDSPDFAGSLLPPMRTGDWLAKPRSRIAASFTEVDQALEWLTAQHGIHFRDDPVGLEVRLEAATQALPHGVDVQWGEWLPGGRFATVGVICCPNRHVRHPCPRQP
ncbi:hypothetical protein ACIBHX_33295 [Nonomuraea sp. NPDC050536]|uniref:hypothetical protein n=1 Tax=Nonomuraea sp. NPDC050536 TaxID=3364366 RepID=UPI0037CB68A4